MNRQDPQTPGYRRLFACARLLPLLILLPLSATPASAAAAQPQPQVQTRPDLASHTRDQIQLLQDEKSRRSPAQRKLDSQLVLSGRRHRGESLGKGLDGWRPALRQRPDGRILVDLKAEVTPALIDQIQQAGGTVVNQFPRYHAIRAWIPLGSMEVLASRPEVQKIRPASEAITSSGAVDSEGDITHQADVARTRYAIGGAGIRIGVLSDGVGHLAESQLTGDLPSVNILPGQAGDPNGAEGTAMMEIIHDLAPEAELTFATAFNSEASFAQNIRDLHAAGCRIIVDDVSYFSESPFQDDDISQAINEVSAAGTLVFSAAGNAGNKNDGTASVWEGDFVDGGVASLGRGGRLHDFGGATFNAFLAGGGFRRVDLFWADPLGKSANDYDVFVLDAAGNVIASSTNIQDGNDDPYEAIGNLTTGDRVVIVKVSGAPRFLHLSTGRGRLAITTHGRLSGHNGNGAANMFSVAATWVRSPAAPFVGGPNDPVETFTSDGPRRVFFNPDGSAITPGNFSSTGGLVRQKPDITAADGAATSVPGFEQFFGTSAAAPHAAAVAALVWSYNPSLSASQVRTALLSSALDIEAIGPDQDSGAGIVMAPAAVEAAPAPAPRLAYQRGVVSGGDGNGTIDRNECDQLYLQIQNLVGLNGQPAQGVQAVLRSLTSSLVVDPTPIPFPDIPPSATRSNQQPFLLSTLPGFVCGSPVRLEALIQSSSGSVTQQFELPSTLPGIAPPIAFTSTNVPKIIPDLGIAESSVAVSGLDLALADVSVEVMVQHPYVSDLILTLTGPDGTAVQLSNRNGDGGQNYGLDCQHPTVFEDRSTNRLVFAVAPFAGSFQPQEPLLAFRGKSGTAANGVWKLTAQDVAEPDSGILECWTLRLAPYSCPDSSGPCFSPPVVVSQPVPLTVTNGSSARFSVVAGGSLPIHYQWVIDGSTPLSNQTNATLELTSATPANAGLYSVILSNRYGVVESTNALLTVLVPSTITQQPHDLAVTNGGSATFSVVAIGSAPLSFQWYRGSANPIAGATASTLTLPKATPQDAGSYTVVVSNPYGTVTSQPAQLTVGVPPAITQQPISVTANQGSTVSFTVTAEGSSPLSYQWFVRETTAVPGATSPTLTLKNVQSTDAGGYHVTVSNAYGQATSQEGVLAVTVPNTPPTITLLSPVGTTTVQSTNLPILISAVAQDGDGSVASVTFVADGRPLATLPQAPYEFSWTDPSAGTHLLQAVATDNLGARGTSAVAVVTMKYPANGLTELIPTGSVWRYLDDGSDQGTAWTEPNFPDGTWKAGPAELGYGDAADGRPEATVLSFGPSASNKYLTYYFRHAFVVTDSASYTNLHVRLLRDDGAVVYLNGVEWFRNNMPSGTITYRTTASGAINGNGETTYQATNLPPALLRSGTNIVAVEIHQSSTNSTDISFDFELTGTRSFAPRWITQPQDLTLNSGESGELVAEAVGGEPLAYQWFRNRTNRIAGATNAIFSLLDVTTNASGNYALLVTNLYGRLTSSVATVTVVPVVLTRPPTIAITTPNQGSAIAYSNLPVIITLTPSDPDNNLASVNLLADGRSIASFVKPPWTFEWNDPLPGSHALTAIATDDTGLSATSSVVRIDIKPTVDGQIPLIGFGSVWKYYDKSSDPGASWTDPDFDDTSWASGPAELGYGDTADGRPEATVISFGPLSLIKYTTAYFRRSFFLTEPASFNAIRFQLLRDDGAVVYLNGVEQFRDNLPDTTISFGTLASTAINGAAETNLVTREITSPVLRAGWNEVAVEVHQSSLTSSDLSFDLSVTGLRTQPPTITRQPQSLTTTNGGTVQFSVTALGPAPLAYHWFFNGNPLGNGSISSNLILSSVGLEDSGNYQCQVSNTFGFVLSSNAVLKVQNSSANLAPAVALTAPLDGSTFEIGASVVLDASASDSDGQVLQVEFFVDGARIGVDTSSPYEITWASPTPGLHALWAVATDNLGLASTSAVVRITGSVPTLISRTLIATGSVWRYQDTGTDLRTSWRRRIFNDASWSNGPALLGYGNAAKGRPEATLLRFGPDPNLKYPTYYFRKTFLATNIAQISRLQLRAIRDDGIAVFLNGTRVWKDNLPAGDPGYTTLAVTSITGTNETTWVGTEPDATLLVEGTNTLAVEIHQASRVSDDVAFDLSLTAEYPAPPLIVSEPQDQTVTNGFPATFSVSAFGGGTLSYQWYFNATNLISGAIGSSFTVSNALPANAGTYAVVIKNAAGSIRSREARLKVVTPPPNQAPQIVLLSPTNQAVYVQGSLVTLSATATDPDGTVVRVEFYDQTNLLARLTNSPYILDWSGAALGSHSIRALAVDDRAGTNLTPAATFTVVPPPPPPSLITTLVSTGSVWKYLDTGVDAGTAWRTPSYSDDAWPSGPAELGYGDSVEGRPEATLLSFGPSANNKYISYYFRQSFEISDPSSFSNLTVRLLRDDGGIVYLNGVEVFRSNMPTGAVNYLTLASSAVNKQFETTFYETNINAQLLVQGVNVLAVEIHQASANSSDISFDLELLGTRPGVPVIITQPAPQTVVPGRAAQFSVSAGGSTPLFYQWYRNGLTPVSGGTNPTLVLLNVQSADAGSYSVLVTNALGSVRSSPAVLTLANLPEITQQPQPVVASPGENVSFTVVANSSTPLSYQWFFNSNTLLSGATNTTLALLNVQNAQLGSYRVRLSNAAGSITSAPASLTFATAPVILSDPLGVTVTEGSPVVLSVSAGGAAPLRYQWFFNTNTAIAGATSPDFTLASTTVSNMGFYSVKVSNNNGSITSQQAEVRVLKRPDVLLLSTESNAITVTFSTLSRLRYTVEATDRILPATWTNVPGAIQLKGTGSEVSIQDPLPSPKSRFYRIRVE